MDRSDIFIGYRRDDTGDAVGRIYDRLCARFGKEHVFKDVDRTPIGTNFGAHILGILPRCRVFLAIIGNQWLDVRTPEGARRIDDPQDWVRVELETALNTPGLQVVPVLVNDAAIPAEKDLPDSLRALSGLNAAKVRRDPDFNVDMERLINAIDRGGPVAKPERIKLTLRSGLIAAAALAAVFFGLNAMKTGAAVYTPGGVAIPGIDPAGARVVGDASWPPSDIAAMARRATDYVHKKWRPDAVLMTVDLKATPAGGLDARFTYYSADQEQQVTLMEGMLTSPYPHEDDVSHAISGAFMDLQQAIDAAHAAGLHGKQIDEATLEWSSGESCGAGNFAIDNAILPKCPPGPRFEGLQWMIHSALGNRKYVPAHGG
ncbi:MAG: TIR domain-containing protein [Alphaproteobacteria bacterium]